MTRYNVYLVDQDGTLRAREVVEHKSDDAAIKAAWRRVGRNGVEVWRGVHCVVRIPGEPAVFPGLQLPNGLTNPKQPARRHGE